MKSWIHLLALLFLIITSCKNSDERKNHIGSVDSIRVSAPPLRIVRFTPQWHHQAQFAGYYVALEKGFYHHHGLDVQISNGGPENRTPTALKNGTTDFGTMFLLSAMREFDQDNRAVNISQTFQRSSIKIVGSISRGINSIQSLNNKKIGLWRMDYRELSLLFLKNNNLNTKIVDIDFSINPFIIGSVDAINVMEYNEYHQLIQSGYEPDDLWVHTFTDDYLNIPEDGIYVREDFYKANTDLCDDFVDASMQGWLYAINNIDEAVDIVMKYMREHHIPANRPHQKWMLSTIREIILAKPQALGKLDKKDFDKANNVLLNSGMISKLLIYEEFCPQ